MEKVIEVLQKHYDVALTKAYMEGEREYLPVVNAISSIARSLGVVDEVERGGPESIPTGMLNWKKKI